MLATMLFSTTVLGSQWPTFLVLTPAFLESKILTTQGCPSGEWRVPIATKILIQTTSRIKHDPWYWVYEGDGLCQQRSTISYTSFIANGHFEGSRLIASYADADKLPWLNFVFTVPADWDCGPLTPKQLPAVIGCAQDT